MHLRNAGSKEPEPMAVKHYFYSNIAVIVAFKNRVGPGKPPANSACQDKATFLRSLAMETSQVAQYIPVLLLAVIAVAFAGGTLVLSVLFGARGRRTRIKDTPYECGMVPVGEGNARMSVKFYLVAMLFILFDIEVVFLYPWAVVYKEMLRDNANQIFGSMVSFLGVLFVGYIYALKKKAFDWKN
jgi:NADH-quinone oxidoreductase subunit A